MPLRPAAPGASSPRIGSHPVSAPGGASRSLCIPLIPCGLDRGLGQMDRIAQTGAEDILTWPPSQAGSQSLSTRHTLKPFRAHPPSSEASLFLVREACAENRKRTGLARAHLRDGASGPRGATARGPRHRPPAAAQIRGGAHDAKYIGGHRGPGPGEAGAADTADLAGMAGGTASAMASRVVVAKAPPTSSDVLSPSHGRRCGLTRPPVRDTLPREPPDPVPASQEGSPT